MQEKLDFLGAVVAHVVFISSIITFASRMIFKLQPGHWVGVPILLMAFPLGYLLVLNPDYLAEGLRAQQAEAERASQALRDRLALVEESIAEHDQQIERLLDLYLSSDDFPKELLGEKKARLTSTRQELEKEREEFARHLQQTAIPDARIEEIEEFCRQVSEGLENASFEDKRQILDFLDVRGKLAVEDGQKVVYVSCVIDQARLPIGSSTVLCKRPNKHQPITVTARIVLKKLRKGEGIGGEIAQRG